MTEEDLPPASIDDTFLTTKELAARWRCEVGTLNNMRYRGEGVSYVRLLSGKVLYRVSDILAAETTGRRGFTWRRLEVALAAYEMEPKEIARLMEHLKRVMVPKDRGSN